VHFTAYCQQIQQAQSNQDFFLLFPEQTKTKTKPLRFQYASKQKLSFYGSSDPNPASIAFNSYEESEIIY